jgi:two-component system, sensor histidine kinase and response regulator
MDGLETSRRVLGDPAIPRKPKIILVTAYGNEHLMQQAEEEGLQGFLMKPVSPSLMLDAIAAAFAEGAPAERQNQRRRRVVVSEQLRGAKVLLAEDNEINQQVAEELLRGAGIEVVIANNGREAVDWAEKERFDCVLMDIQMPILNGYEATQLLRANPELKDLVIIAMTASAMAGDREKALAVGMNDHIAKPIDPGQLFATLKQWVTPRQQGVAAADDGKESLESPAPEATGPDGIDFDDGLARVAGNRKLYRNLLAKFRASNQEIIAAIGKAVERGEDETAQRLVHTLKGVSGNIGARAVHSAAQRLEHSLKHGDRESTAAGLQDLGTELERVLDGIQAWEGRLQQPRVESPSTPFDLASLQPLVDRFEELLRADDFEAQEQLDVILNRLGDSQLAESFTELRSHIGRYDFEEALRLLRRIKGAVIGDR